MIRTPSLLPSHLSLLCFICYVNAHIPGCGLLQWLTAESLSCLFWHFILCSDGKKMQCFPNREIKLRKMSNKIVHSFIHTLNRRKPLIMIINLVMRNIFLWWSYLVQTNFERSERTKKLQTASKMWITSNLCCAWFVSEVKVWRRVWYWLIVVLCQQTKYYLQCELIKYFSFISIQKVKKHTEKWNLFLYNPYRVWILGQNFNFRRFLVSHNKSINRVIN